MKPVFDTYQIRPCSGAKPNSPKKAFEKNLPSRHQNPNLCRSIKEHIEKIPKEHWISVAAYFKSEAKNFTPGCEQTDWLEAEQDYIEMLVDLFLCICREDGIITMTGLQQLASAIGVQKPECIDSKLELIRLIQSKSNRQPCFRTNPGEFCRYQADCQWSNECQKLVAEYWR